jgi:hypothetical protein
MSQSTPVFLDMTCFRKLRLPEARRALESYLASIDAVVMPSEVNFMEALRHPSSELRTSLLETLQHLAKDKPVMPWPYALLAQVAESVLAGKHGFELTLRFRPEVPITDAFRNEVDTQARELDNDFADLCRKGRSPIRAFVRAKDLAEEWKDARVFLDEFWMRPSQIDPFLLGVWRRLKLLEPAPADLMRSNPTWRLFLEALGVAVFEQCIERNQPRPFGMLDVLQLTYAAGFPSSTFVTNDEALRRAAEVLLAPIPGARVVTWETLALASGAA